MLEYEDLLNVPVHECGEKMVVVQEAAPDIVCEYQKFDMKPYVGSRMLLREGVVRRLRQVSEKLQQKDPQAELKIVYAYRHPDVQERYFLLRVAQIKEQCPDIKEREIHRRAHRLSASPDVAGHPTGGAIDLTILHHGKEIQMGTRIADFSDTEKIQTFSSRITKKEKEHRVWLRTLMTEQGFAPFDGEWWHFSFGDKEWAVYAKEPAARYGALKI